MNIENVNAAINIMKRAQSLDMEDWQERAVITSSLAKTEEELHSCGNTACFAGYLAISPEFIKDGGSQSLTGGMPILSNGANERAFQGCHAVEVWLGVSRDTADALVYGNCNWDDEFEDDKDDEAGYSKFYGKRFRSVKPTDVIAKLELILAGELK